MPKIDDNGVVREMTPEEVAEMDRAPWTAQARTREERIAALEEGYAELARQVAALQGGVNNAAEN